MRKTLPEKVEQGRVTDTDSYLGSDASYGMAGAFMVMGSKGEMLAIISSGVDQVHGWEHVSVSTKRRIPNWEEMCQVKDWFWGEEECVIQYHPPKSEYVNVHPYCLHMWRPINHEIIMPPMLTVGQLEEEA